MAGRRRRVRRVRPASSRAPAQAPTATRTKSVANATNRPTSSATLAAIGSANFRQTAIISLKTRSGAPAARPRNTIDSRSDVNE